MTQVMRRDLEYLSCLSPRLEHANALRDQRTKCVDRGGLALGSVCASLRRYARRALSRWPSSRCTTRANFLNDGVDVARAEPSMAVASAAMAVAELWLLLRLRLLLSYARAW
mgnify:CR=1 FL=1